MNAGVRALAVYNGELIAAGDFTMAGGVACNYIARWNGSSWQALSSGVNSTVYALAVNNNQLAAGGTFSMAGGTSVAYAAVWDGAAWSPAGSGVTGCNVLGSCDVVRTLASYNGELIAGGGFYFAGGVVAKSLARWNGTAWRSLHDGKGICGQDQYPTVNALSVYNNELVATGSFFSAGPVLAKGIGRWNGSDWRPLGSGLGTAGSESGAALVVFNNELIAGGSFNTAGGVSAHSIARWNGTSWQPLGSGTGGAVFALTIYNGELIAGGYFTTAGGASANRIASWNGSTWQALGAGVSGPAALPAVFAMTVYNGELIAAGEFTSAGGVPANNIARWNGSAWQPLANGLTYPCSPSCTTRVYALTVYNGDLIAGGTFNIVAANSCACTARWNGTSWQQMGSGGHGSRALTVFNGALIGSGLNLGRWNGTDWEVIGGTFTGYSAVVDALGSYNGDLIAAGLCTAVGNVTSYNWARWGSSCKSGDLNCDQVVNESDIPLFVDGLLDISTFSPCERFVADMNGDSQNDGNDIPGFVAAVLGL